MMTDDMMVIRNVMMAMVVIILEMKNVCRRHKQLTDMDIQDLLIPQPLKMEILNTFTCLGIIKDIYVNVQIISLFEGQNGRGASVFKTQWKNCQPPQLGL